VTYLVAGGTRELSTTQCTSPATKYEWFALLDRLGWALDGEAEKRIHEAAKEAKNRLDQVGLQSKYAVRAKTLHVPLPIAGESHPESIVPPNSDSIVDGILGMPPITMELHPMIASFGAVS
jgi:hypothetical protein